jgi:hypothetical protein
VALGKVVDNHDVDDEAGAIIPARWLREPREPTGFAVKGDASRAGYTLA